MIPSLDKPPVYVICGQTATGKSARAVQLAQEIGGEVISADSRQVYRGMDIGTAKITPEEMEGIPHHMIDIVYPSEVFHVVDFRRLGRQAIDEILSRGKVPIICGGTGYYIDALVFDHTLPEVAPNEPLRSELELLSALELFEKLVERDAERAAGIDRHNRVRLIRALEIVEALGKVPLVSERATSPYDIRWVYLDLPNHKLQERIHERNSSRVHGGLIQEVERLHAEGLSWDRLDSLGLEYRYVSAFLRGEISTINELIEILDIRTRQYVKRQRTWFKKHLPPAN